MECFFYETLKRNNTKESKSRILNYIGNVSGDLLTQPIDFAGEINNFFSLVGKDLADTKSDYQPNEYATFTSFLGNHQQILKKSIEQIKNLEKRKALGPYLLK